MNEVLISGYYGFKNSGDDALLLSIIQELRKHKGDIHISVLSANPKETSEMYGIEAVSRINPFHIMGKMREAELFILGGGTLIQDGTSTKSLLYYLGMILLAKIFRTKVMLYSNGIDPLLHKTNACFAKFVLNKVDVITLRDEASLNELNNMGVDRPKIRLTADPAFMLQAAPPETGKRILKNFEVDMTKKLLCVSVRPWANLGEGFEDIVAKAADYAASQYGFYTVFLPMQYPKDAVISRRIAEKMKNKSCVLDMRLSAENTLSVIGNMDLCIGMRLHTLIYSASQGVPFIGLVYNPKVNGFMDYMKQSLYENVENISLDMLKKLIDSCMSNYKNIKEELCDTIQILKDRSEQNAKYAVALLENRETEV
ncbi:MAG: polysaccharide pyruvyl transferase CsaB [Clostridia bacterium]|nr:polysaccharide pyruvyl transferase CsaB [Clostridia bacterium]